MHCIGVDASLARSWPSNTRLSVSNLACSFWLNISPFIGLRFSLDSHLLTDSLVNNNLIP